MTPLENIEPTKDGAVLHFLKELPAWCVIGLFVSAFLATWHLSHDDFIPRIIDGLVGALLTSIIAQRPKQLSTIQADSVTTPALTTGSMDNSTIQAENVTLDKSDKTQETNDG